MAFSLITSVLRGFVEINRKLSFFRHLMGQLYWRYPGDCNEHWGGEPIIPIRLKSLNHWYQVILTFFMLIFGKICNKWLKFAWNAWECVCVCVRYAFKGPKRFNHSFCIFQFIWGKDQNWGKSWCFLANPPCVSFTYVFYNSYSH